MSTSFDIRLAVACLLLGLMGDAHATLLWDEAVDGDLPNVLFTEDVYPNLTLQSGENEIRGTGGWVKTLTDSTYDADRTRLSLLPGLQIDSIDFAFFNLVFTPPDDSIFSVLRAGYALTKGRYAFEDAVFVHFWDFFDNPPRAEFVLEARNDLPIGEPSNEYLFGSWVAGASLPAEANYEWDFSAVITVSGTPVPLPSTLSLVAISLAAFGCLKRRTPSQSRT